MNPFRAMRYSALPIGMDLSPAGARLLQFRETRAGLAVVDALRVDIDSPCDTGSMMDQLAPVLKMVQRRLPMTEFKGRKCIVGLSQDLLRIRSIRQPRMPQEEADRAVQLEAPDRLGYSEDEPDEIGWIRAGEVRQSDQLRDEVIVIGAGTESMEWLVNTMVDMRLRPMAVEPSFIAVSRCFERAGRRAADESVTRLLIDIGESSTNLLVLQGSSISFYKSFQIGGARMTDLVAERLGLELQSAKDLRRQRSQPGRRQIDGLRDERTEQAIFDAIRPSLDDLCREVSLCLRYYAVSFIGSRPTFALITGAEAAEPKIVEHMQRVLGIPTVLGKPFDNVILHGALQGLEHTPLAEWSAAAGLALRGSNVSIERPLVSHSKDHASPSSDEAPGEVKDERNAA